MSIKRVLGFKAEGVGEGSAGQFFVTKRLKFLQRLEFDLPFLTCLAHIMPLDQIVIYIFFFNKDG